MSWIDPSLSGGFSRFILYVMSFPPHLVDPSDWSGFMPTSQRCQLASLSSRLTVLRSSPSSRAAPWRILFAPCSRTWSAPHSAPPPDIVGGRHLQRRHLHPDSSSSDLV